MMMDSWVRCGRALLPCAVVAFLVGACGAEPPEHGRGLDSEEVDVGRDAVQAKQDTDTVPPKPVCASDELCCVNNPNPVRGVCRAACQQGEIDLPEACHWGTGLCGTSSCESQCLQTCTDDRFPHLPTFDEGYCDCSNCHAGVVPADPDLDKVILSCVAFCASKNSHNSTCAFAGVTGGGDCRCRCESDCSD
jgi:hypothetical protein